MGLSLTPNIGANLLFGEAKISGIIKNNPTITTDANIAKVLYSKSSGDEVVNRPVP